MTTSSAKPEDLDAFVSGTATTRGNAAATAAGGSTFGAGVIAGCSGRGVSVTNFGAVSTLLENMAANEAFVQGVVDALRQADVHNGVATMTDTAIASTFVSGAYETTTHDVQIQEASMLGAPPTSGFVDDPVCTANGNFIHSDHDLEFPGTSASMNVHRFYNSCAAGRVGVFGAGWTSVFDVEIDGLGSERIEVQLADGARLRFTRDSRDAGDEADGGRWVTDDRRDHHLQGTPDGWTMHTGPASERRWHFDGTGRLTGWEVGTSRVELTLDDHGRPGVLREGRSDRSVSIGWTGERISSLVTDDGRRVAYGYGDHDTLTRVETRSGWFGYEYDGALMLRALDPDGVSQFDNVYDHAGRVVRQTSPFGRMTDYRYEISGSTVITDESGVRQAMVHDRRGHLTAVIDADGSAMRLGYDDAGRVVEVVSKTGATWAYEFDDDAGDLVRRVDPDGLSQSWTWDEQGRKISETDRAGAVTSFEYAGGHATPSRVTGPDGSVATAELNEWDQPTRVVDPDGVVTHLEWDRDGQLVRMTDAEGHATAFEFDDAGLLTRIIDPLGTDTEIAYDTAGRVVRSAQGEQISTYRRTAAGRVDGGVEPGDIPWSATFGSHGAVESVSDALGATMRYEYDPTGNVAALTAPDGAVYRQQFDEVGRLVAVIDAAGATARKSYDREGRLIGFVDPEGRETRRVLDALGRTSASTAADGAITRWTYHPNGEVATVTSPDGRTWMSEIDSFGRVTAVTDPAGGRATRVYSSAGRLLSRTSPAGRTESYEYDDAGRCVTVVGVDGVRRRLKLDGAGRVTGVALQNPDDADGAAAAELGVLWDEHGRLAGYRTEFGESRIERDAGGRVLGSIDATGAATRFGYDARGLLATATDPAGGSTSFEYDTRGRLAAQTAPGGRTTSWGYDLAGYVSTMIDPAGVTTDVTRDGTGIVTAQHRGDTGWTRTLDAAGREIERRALDDTVLGQFAYDRAGRLVGANAPGTDLFTEFLWDDTDHVTAVTDSTGTSTIERDADGWAVAFTSQGGTRTVVERDANGRVVGVRDDHAGGFAGPPADVTVDPAGRLLIGPDGTVYRYDDAGRLAELAPVDGEPTVFEYGDDGLVVAERGTNSTRRFTYDIAGRVASITVDGRGTTAITYDDAGRRATEVAPDGSHTAYGWNHLDQLVAITRTAVSGEVTRVAIDVDALGRPQRVNDIDIGYDALSGDPNRVGEVRIVNAGAATWRSDDERWGRLAPGSPAGLRIGGLTLLGARAYDPLTRQFLSADPLRTVPGTNGGASAYTYAWQDPINYVDPSGLRPISIAEYSAIREREEQGRLGQAWEAIKEDPWGTLAVVGLVGAAILIGGPVGLGIAIGMGMAAGVGLATGTFSPTQIAIGGVVGGVTGGVGSLTSSTSAAVATGGVMGAGSDLASQMASGQPINWNSVIVSGGVGVTTAGLGAGTSSYTSTTIRAAAVGSATDASADIAYQALTGDGTIDWNSVAVSGVSGAGSSALSHHFAPPVGDTTDITPALDASTPQLALPAGPTRLALPAGDGFNPWPIDNPGVSFPVPAGGMDVEMAMAPGQTRPGGWATQDSISDVNFVRNDLAVLPEFKAEISHAQTYHIPEGVQVQVGEVGPQSDGTTQYPGGANQVAILNYDDRASLIPIGDPRPLE